MTELADLAVRWAAAARPGEQIEIYVEHVRDTAIRVYQGGVEQLTAAESQGVGIRVVDGGRVGFAYAGVLDDDVVRETLAEARDNAAFATPDEWAGLAAPDGCETARIELWSDEVTATATARKVDLALDLERACLAADPRVAMEDANYRDRSSEVAVATSTGITSASREASCYVLASTLASQAGETQTGFGFSVGRRPRELDVAKAAADAAARATRLLGATRPRTQRLTVVLDPFVTAQFLEVLSRALSGEAVLKGRSFFADRVGEQVGSARLTLADDPTDMRAYGATAIDAEGLATRRNVLIDAGVLHGFVHNARSGRQSGAGSTGSAVRGGFKSTPAVGCPALALTPGDRGAAELIAGVDQGVLVQSVSGIHSGVNPVSGDFSTGAEGLLIEDGAVGAPVREFTIASTLQRMLHDIVAVGNDVEWLPMDAAGVSLVIADVTVSGT